MPARHDLAERIVTGAGVVASRTRILRSAKLFRRIRRDQRLLHPALCSAEGKPLISWSLRNVYPFSWSGPDLDALSVGIAREKLVLCHEGFL